MKYLACAGFALAFLPAARAQPPEAGAPTPEIHNQVHGEGHDLQPEIWVVASSEGDTALDLEALSDLRGGEAVNIQHTNQTLTATNSGNTINGDTIGSGAMNINANAFNGYDGIGNFVINTGHNNNLMGSVSVNVMVTPQ